MTPVEADIKWATEFANEYVRDGWRHEAAHVLTSMLAVVRELHAVAAEDMAYSQDEAYNSGCRAAARAVREKGPR